MNNETYFTETIRNLRNRTTVLDHEGDYWTEDEKRRLKQMFEASVGISQIAIILQRSEPALMQQIEALDLYHRKANPKRHRHCKTPTCKCKKCEVPAADCPLGLGMLER